MELTLSLKYLCCGVDNKGYFNCFNSALTSGLACASLIELNDLGLVSIEKKYATITGKLPDSRPWLAPMYNALLNPANNSDIGEVIHRMYQPVFTDTHVRATLEAYLEPLVKEGLLTRKRRALSVHESFIIDQGLLQELRDEVEATINAANDGTADDAETLTFVVLLHRGRALKQNAPHIDRGHIKSCMAMIDAISDEPLRSKLDENSYIMSAVAFSTSALGGGLI